MALFTPISTLTTGILLAILGTAGAFFTSWLIRRRKQSERTQTAINKTMQMAWIVLGLVAVIVVIALLLIRPGF
jgi:hypothetical protein